ncbi:MAG: invasion associated locus B family protein [Nitrospirota bacterium]|nr:invasion associated locus B family protein [Nitrospirota bacterium]
MYYFLIILWLFSFNLLLPIEKVHAFTEKIFGSWSLVCTETCALSQVTATDPEGRKVVLGVSVYFPPSSTVATIDFRFSSTAKTEGGMGLKVDDFPSFKLPISHCDERVCLASGYVEEPLLSQFMSGTLAKIAVLLEDSKQMILPFSLIKFKEAYSELKMADSDRSQKFVPE